MKSYRIEPISDVRTSVGESPAWSVSEKCLYSVDIWSKTLWRHDVQGVSTAYIMPEMAAAVLIAERGVLVALETHLLHGHPEHADWVVINAPDDHPASHRFNDACVDPLGRLVIGTMRQSHLGAEPTGKLYVYANKEWTVLATGLWTCNGLAFSPDGRTLYFSDSHSEVQKIWAADYDPIRGIISATREFACLRPFAGRPDGAAIDSQGNYWIAGVGGGCLYCFDNEGGLRETIALPVENPTKVAFGGAGLTELFVTSMAEKLTLPNSLGLAGSILSFEVEVAGLPATPVSLAPTALVP